jgi:hypothetical protein
MEGLQLVLFYKLFLVLSKKEIELAMLLLMDMRGRYQNTPVIIVLWFPMILQKTEKPK